MPDVFIDFETRSLADLPKVGAWKYAAHESTYPLMLAAVFPEFDRRLQWREYTDGRECPTWVARFAIDPGMRVHAHYANFEIAIWRKVCVERWGWPDIPTDRWRDTAGKTTHANLPRALAQVAKTIRAKTKKDPSGRELINQLSMPRKSVLAKMNDEGDPRIDNRDYLKSRGVEFFELDDDNGPVWYWENDAKLLRKFAKYNEVDVIAEMEVDSMVPPYSGREQEVWVLDSIINERGIPIDRQLCEAAIELFEHEADRAEVGIQNLTDGAVTKPTQNARMIKWIAERDYTFGPSMAKEYVADWLFRRKNDKAKSTSEIRDLLYFRDILGGAAIKKYQAALSCADDDDRARGQLLYYGASTGRWAGKGIQIHNFFRASIPDENVFELVKTADHAEVRAYCKANNLNVTDLLKRCVRGLICAPEGKTLIVSDFAGIEDRVLQWLAGNQEDLESFRRQVDMYVQTASRVFEVSYSEMMGSDGCKPEYKDKRQVGKICRLALGYGMGWAKYLATCEAQGGVTISDDQAQTIVKQWRESNPLVVQLWRRVEKAFKAVIRNRKIVARVANEQGFGVRIGYDDRDFIWIELPGGRKLYYYQARLVEDPRSDWGPRIVYRDGGKGEVDTYGGKLIENCLGGNTLVLTEFGWKQIRHVTLEERIFDGIDWVNHGGPIYQGVRPVGELFDVVMTPDHQIFSREGWKSASQCEGFNTSSIRVSDGHRVCRFEWAKESLESALRVWENCDPLGFRTGSQTWARDPILWLQSLGSHVKTTSDPPDVETSGLRRLAESTIAMYEAQASCLQKLRRSRDSSVVDFVRGVLGGYGPRIQAWIRHRSARQQWTLLQSQLSMGDSKSELRKPPKFDKDWRLFHPRIKPEIGDFSQHALLSPQTRVATFDLLNCGPRRQFVIMSKNGPMIVHNCVQAIARDLLVHSMFLAEEKGLVTIGHVHDELIIEHDEDGVELGHEELHEAMSTCPPWAAGLPLAAETWIGKRYSK